MNHFLDNKESKSFIIHYKEFLKIMTSELYFNKTRNKFISTRLMFQPIMQARNDFGHFGVLLI